MLLSSSMTAIGFSQRAEGKRLEISLALTSILACLVPVAVSDISAPVQQSVYATDASLSKGAIVKTEVSTQRLLYETGQWF